jgi:hypothetical protein
VRVTRRHVAAACVVVLVAVAAVGVVWSLRDRSPAAAPPPAETRPTSFTVCPRPSLRALGSRVVLEDAILRNLGGNVMGHEISYRYRGRPLSVYVGYDILEVLEDLDFEVRHAVVAKRRVAIHTPKALGSSGRMRVASWEDERLDGPCREIAVVTRQLPQSALLEVVSAVAA